SEPAQPATIRKTALRTHCLARVAYRALPLQFDCFILPALGKAMGTNIQSIGKFQVLEPLGTGANSTILHIRRSADSKHYALKVVPIGTSDERKFLDQAQHEFRVAQMLDHPNLIQIYALETVRDWLFRTRKLHLLIEYVNGKTLDILPRLSIPR